MSRRILIFKFTHHLWVDVFFPGSPYFTFPGQGLTAASQKVFVTLADSLDPLHEAMILIFFTCHINENAQHLVVPDLFYLEYHFTFILRLK